jgi:hypothetical protein
MTQHQQALLNEAKDMWERGFKAPELLTARMAMAGMDVIKLEATYLTQQEGK